MNARKTYIALCVWAVVFMAAGCASQRVVTDLDSAGYRVSNGYKFLDRGMVEEAEREFKAASDMERHFSPAFAGLAIARAEQGHFDLAAHLIQQATTYAQDPTTQAEVEVANIRILTIEKQKDWIERAMTSFNRATALNPRSMAPYFFLGRAFKESYNFKNAEEMFLKAAGPPNPYQARARSEAALVAAVIGYAPQSMAAKKAVLEGRVNRAELAAILTQEFDVARFAPPGTRTTTPCRRLGTLPIIPIARTSKPSWRSICPSCARKPTGCFIPTNRSNGPNWRPSRRRSSSAPPAVPNWTPFMWAGTRLFPTCEATRPILTPPC